MPYIKKDFRKGASILPISSGELNYKLTLAIQEYWERIGHRYSTINDIVGAIEGCKAEFQRRIVGPYEDGKIALNGDVYTYENKTL